MTDLDKLIDRLEIPWPGGGKPNEVVLPAWIIGLCAEAAATLEAMQAENADLTHDLGRAQAALSEFATENERLRMEAHMAKSAVKKLEAMIAKHAPR